MSVIFYEKEYAQSLLENGTHKLLRRDLNYIAKYWDHEGLSEREIEKKLIEFCLKNDENFNVVQNYEFYHASTIHARNNRLRIPTPIRITKSELDAIAIVDDIDEIDGYKIQKFLFVMLAVAKFFKYHPSRKNIKGSKYDQYLYSNTGINDLKELAGVTFTKEQWKRIKHVLTVMNLINPTIVGAKKWAVGLWDELSPTIIEISDYRNIVSYYQDYAGENMVECIQCGVKISRKSNRHSYCKSCWQERRREQSRIRAARYREKNNG